MFQIKQTFTITVISWINDKRWQERKGLTFEIEFIIQVPYFSKHVYGNIHCPNENYLFSFIFGCFIQQIEQIGIILIGYLSPLKNERM